MALILADRLADLLACMLDELDPAPCRSAVYPGAEAPWDSCESTAAGNGQAWTLAAEVTPGWPEPPERPTRCLGHHTAQVHAGVTRCATAVVGDDGRPPSVAAVETDTALVHADREAVLRAITCCLLADDRDVIVDSWEPLGPEGGCVGGLWKIRLQIAGCGCR